MGLILWRICQVSQTALHTPWPRRRGGGTGLIVPAVAAVGKLLQVDKSGSSWSYSNRLKKLTRWRVTNRASQSSWTKCLVSSSKIGTTLLHHQFFQQLNNSKGFLKLRETFKRGSGCHFSATPGGLRWRCQIYHGERSKASRLGAAWGCRRQEGAASGVVIIGYWVDHGWLIGWLPGLNNGFRTLQFFRVSCTSNKWRLEFWAISCDSF